MMPRAPLLVAVALLCALALLVPAAAVEEAGDLSAEHRAELREMFAKSKDHFVCAGIGVIDMGSAVDGPLFYFEDATREPISVCGGACMLPRGRQQQVCATLCPPPRWRAASCDEKRNAAYWASRPDLSEARLMATAASFSQCNRPDVPCQIRSRRNPDNGQWIFDIVYVEQTPPHGVARVVLDPKGRIVSYY